ncbi:MAG: Tetratricopeptide TPR_2 repeat protein [Candidatus Amesbacteria bacterium GW2011_GWB1_47_26]|uniref:Tetratricopeptide TPR_2 repeat protein n=1 Tax=Candidatus Amesbacteria bacterium GW2011_GWC2_45_19 TaxID=1618366 RepID=A0A0G1M3Y7_9BACT|nr:MAG: Tetratricopeptide TPR_2 repeat protein [Candidatus Amesbacteria bacterium GW2011_GWC2_45_19]KKU38378.1 MAG: Tetratricopeptide TPR_2 repeat protein [Candidatus Amesbacteria bacterium GW2011_GWA1_46_35]KKU68780.1 MAG: hypothetical protein UX93_C0005G0016 [Microgenomates group bacterium GW2011_GWC1_47_20]KKU74920.1 MAG: Tetratricopeptide TPR_2 repeat protein [Candidatus Amesbacteria bacterium GW2011_GWB1_47_26]KKU80093.1 MAG: Tetratricopeptide TPR_2 repeat protein [Candidatus Amesbacteria 
MHPTPQAKQAIDAALTGNWKEAVKINLLILKHQPRDIEALNRLGRSFMEIGHKSKAENAYKKVLRLDKFNTIATRNLVNLKTSRLTRLATGKSSYPQTMFLEEPGVTKTIQPIRPGDAKVISRLHPGDPVKVVVRQHNVVAITTANEYLARFPDDLASRLRTLIQAGNTYSAFIRSIDPLKIFVRETGRGAKYHSTPSFPLTEKLTYAAFTPPELIHEEKPDVSATEEQEEESFTEENPPSPLAEE